MVTYYALALSKVLSVTRFVLVTLQRSSQEKNVFKAENLKDEKTKNQVRQKIAIVYKKQFNTILEKYNCHYMWPLTLSPETCVVHENTYPDLSKFAP